MADTFTLDSNLLADIYTAADVVAQEAVGFIPAVTQNSSSEQASKGDSVRAAFTPDGNLQPVTEAMTVPDGEAYSISEKSYQLSNHNAIRFKIGGEDARSMQNNGIYNTIYGDMVAQGMRSIINDLESKLFTEIKNNAGYATADSGSTAFASSLNSIATAREILTRSGTPTDDLSLVVNGSAGVNLRNNTNLLNVNTSGTNVLREQGLYIPIHGFNVYESSQITQHTAGTSNNGYHVNNGSGEVAGETTITTDAGGGSASGTIIQGDIVTFAGLSESYVVGTALAANDFVLNTGLLSDVADDAEITGTVAYTGNFALHRRAAEFAMRAPAEPVGGDSASEVLTVTEPRTGMIFQVRLYRGYHANLIEVGAVYGVKAWKPNFICTIID